jgi:AcrR family transcriptional regulator
VQRRSKGERTEDAFVRAARTVFAEKGYFNTKITDIAREAGRSAGSFYNYYDNKAQLLDALLDQFTNEVTRASLERRSEDPYESIRGAVSAYWCTFRDHLPEMIGLFALSMTDQRYAERWRSVRALGIQGVVAQLRGAQRAGHLPGVEPTHMASAIISMLESFSWTWLVRSGDLGVTPVDDESAIETMTNLWYAAVYGARVPASAP